MNQDKKGMRRNLTSYGDADFSLYLRKAFIKAMGYTEDSLGRPVIGITNTFSGYIPIPRKLARRGVKDMIRISDARMSGTAFGTIILHASPEAAVGGPLELVRDGDLITLNTPERKLILEVSDDELERRRAELSPVPDTEQIRGYLRIFHDHVTQAGAGCDFDFLTSGKVTKRTP